MVGATNLGLEMFRIDLKNVRNRATLFLGMELHLFSGIYKPILSKLIAQIHVYHHRTLPGEVLRP